MCTTVAATAAAVVVACAAVWDVSLSISGNATTFFSLFGMPLLDDYLYAHCSSSGSICHQCIFVHGKFS